MYQNQVNLTYPHQNNVMQERSENGKILIVDDDADILEGYRFIFECEGYNIVTAPTPSDALSKARCTEFKVAILDYMLPNMKGDDLAMELSRIQSGISVVIISGFREALTSIEEKGVKLGGFFSKPISPEVLLKVIGELVGAPGLH